MSHEKRAATNLSDFYLACRHGNLDFVQQYLSDKNNAHVEINRHEEGVNSTPLHAACYYGHKEIAHLLLARGCDRSQVNGYGLTAFEEARNDEIRQMFKRPTSKSTMRRFLDESVDDCFDHFEPCDEPSSEEASPSLPSLPLPKSSHRKPSIKSFHTKVEKQTEIGYAATSIGMCQSKLGRFIADKMHRDSPMSLKTIGNKIQEIIDKELVANKDPDSRKAADLLNKFLNDSSDERIEQLIRLYTLETGFYAALRNNPIPLALPLYMTLQTLKDRFYQGRTYRGAKMTEEEIGTYQRAAQQPGSLLQTKHFSSTSQSRSVAEEFANAARLNPSGNQSEYRALFTFHFPDPCDQAINLSRISDTQPCLSEFEDELEVLILPWTLFHVQSVQQESSSMYTIELVSVLLPPRSFTSSLKWLIKHPRGCMKRFQEYFPEKQPESSVRHLMTTHMIDEQVFRQKN